MPHPNSPIPAAEAVCPRRRLDPRRWALAGAGLLCVAMGAVGVFVPGLPTTIFLIIASWCFAKSCPPLERWLKEQILFRPYTRYLDPAATMPRRARVMVLCFMWTAVIVSGFLFWTRGLLGYAAVPLAIAGLIATISILRFRRGLRTETVSEQNDESTESLGTYSSDALESSASEPKACPSASRRIQPASLA